MDKYRLAVLCPRQRGNLNNRGGQCDFSHRDGQHDDLVLAIALVLWGAKQRPQYAYSFRYLGQGDTRPYGNGVRPYGLRR